jgi:hypothetical protein
MLARGPRFAVPIRFTQATKMARFLICTGKSAIPKAKALAGVIEVIDPIHMGGRA